VKAPGSPTITIFFPLEYSTRSTMVGGKSSWRLTSGRESPTATPREEAGRIEGFGGAKAPTKAGAIKAAVRNFILIEMLCVVMAEKPPKELTALVTDVGQLQDLPI